MSSCSQCGKSTLFDDRKLDGHHYCSAACAKYHPLVQASDCVPPDVLQRHVAQWRKVACPRCKRQDGTLDVYEHHRVHSMILMTLWSTRRSLCCRRCGRRDQFMSVLYSATLGWWGFPWGLLMTPVQIIRNIAGLCRRASEQPSAAFERVVRRQLAHRQLELEAQQSLPSFSARH